MNMLNEALVEISHLAAAAIISDTHEVKVSALADIVQESRRALGANPGFEQQTGSGSLLGELAKEGVKRSNLEIRTGVRLVRFRGDKATTLMAKWTDGTARHVYRIEVAHWVADGYRAQAFIDDTDIFTLLAHTRNRAEKLAVGCLHRWLKDNDRRNRRSKRQRKAKKAARKAVAK